MRGMGPSPHPPERAASRQARLHFVSFNGTWAGGVLSSRKTVVFEFARLISEHENVFEIPVDGVGSDISSVDRVLGGIGGWGTLRNVITAYRNLSKHYMNGDRIVFCGYSRGAWAARYLAMLIDVAGLAKDGDERIFPLLYKACDNGSIFDKNVAARLLAKSSCWPNVQIDALCCFDTVGSLGLPLFGVAKPLSLLRRRRHKVDVISDVAPNIRFAFHCLSLHETRDPYTPTLMSGPTVHQVFFPGNHGNMGWVEDVEGLVHAPFAWMIQQLHSHLHISFDEAKLAARFPSYRPQISAPLLSAGSSPLSETDYHWYGRPISCTRPSVLAIIGKKARQPGKLVNQCEADNRKNRRDISKNRDMYSQRSSSSNSSTATAPYIQVHIGARLRTGIDGPNSVPGYVLVVPVIGGLYWAQQRSEQTYRQWWWIRFRRWGWGNSKSQLLAEGAMEGGSRDHYFRGSGNTMSSNCSKTSRPGRDGKEAVVGRIEEATVGALEASLLGLPEETVVDGCCEFC